ncbi:MAG: SusC/RagA family TonB-linked outer membrane protein [Bacteroidetes bacterium]|nr:SusC/RagA family TonB-linked outer membrane protein [Bacteroidota bacterium]
MRKFTLFLTLLFLIGLQVANAQKRAISGKVSSAEDGKGIPGATVMVKGTTVGVTTDLDGNYQLNVPSEAKVLVFSFIGMKTKEVTLGTQTKIDIILEKDVLDIEGVVVTAIGIKRESKALGYSVQEIGSGTIEKSNNANVINSINGKIAGVQVINSSGAAGSSSFIAIRGRNSILGDNQPLFVVDGVPIDNSQTYSGNPDQGTNNLTEGVAYSNRAIDLNPDDIESVSVLKGGAATALYGLRASNGVVVITTKKGSSGANIGGSRYNVSFSSSVMFETVNSMPKLQKKYAQGQDKHTGHGVQWYGPETGNRNSWGPLLDTMRYTNANLTGSQDVNGDGVYDWDKNGKLVGMSNPDATSKKANVYDNIGDFFKTGVTTNNSLAMSGGTDISTFYFSISNLKNNGVIPLNYFGKTTVKLAGETKLSSKFTVGGSINYINSGGRRMQQGSNVSGVMLGLLRTPITFDNSNGYGKDAVWNRDAYMFPDGSQRSFRGYGIYDNPFWTVNMNQFKDDVNRMIGAFNMTYLANDWMSVTYRLGNDFYSDRRKMYYAINSSQWPSGQVYEDQHFNRDINSDLIFNFKKDFSEALKTTLTLGQNMYQTQHQQVYVEGNTLAVPEFYNLSNAASVLTRETLNRKRTAAFYGDLGMAYMNMWFVNVTGRNEWSTSLPQDKNSFFFPSFSTGFVFTELPGVKDNKAITDILPYGKLRLSYAMVANDAFIYSTKTYYGQTNYGDGWTPGVSFPFAGLTGYMVDNGLGNNKLKPEKMKSFEIGTDLRFLNNRIGLDFTYYKNRNEDVILAVPLAGSSGFTEGYMNAATMENKGIEILLNATPYKTKDFKWDLIVNFTKNKNMVVSLAEGVDNVGLGGFTGAEVRAVAGKPYGSIYGTHWVKDTKGNMVINDDPTDPMYGYPIMADDEAELGTTQPDWTMGITNELSYKGWSLSFLIDIKQGGVMWNGTKGIMYALGTHKDTESRGDSTIFSGVKGHMASGVLVLDSTGALNNKRVVLDQTWYNGLGGGFGGPTEANIEKADWVRLREITLTYTLPKQWISPIGFQSADLYFTGRNLWISTPKTGVDPETNLYGADNAQGIDYFNMPSTKSFTLGLKVTL